MHKETGFGLLWLVAACLMAVDILLIEVYGWPTENPVWWAALIATATLGILTVADYHLEVRDDD